MWGAPSLLGWNMSHQTQKEIRVRFAPSPTGNLHIGGARSAIFNWLFARHMGGKYLLRIEDTDRERYKPEYTDSIVGALAWLGIDHDEHVLIQSSRFSEHQKVIQMLLDTGKAYRCYCTQDEVRERLKSRPDYSEEFSMYDGMCRHRKPSHEDDGKPYAVRFAIPHEEKEVTFNDLIRGPITFNLDQFDDFIIARSDGIPMYNLVVVLDDAFMRITHVIRGEEHTSNTPKQILLYRACGYEVPHFAHLPLILGPTGAKLSKRDAATSVLDYRAMGYLPEALFNYLVRLGWAHGDQEIFTRQELIEHFSLEHVGKKGAIFDMTKLDWLNGVYIREMESKKLLEYTVAYVQPDLRQHCAPWTDEQLIKLIDAYKERVKTLKELAQTIIHLHRGPDLYDSVALTEWIKPETQVHLKRLREVLQDQKVFAHDQLAEALKALCKDLGIKLVALAQPVRIALTGTSASPGIFVVLEVIGQHESVQRVSRLLHQITQEQGM
jgi:glutamyl-tRNA synthetase